MSATDPNLILSLTGPALAVAYATFVGVRGHILAGLVITVLSGLVGWWMWNGLAAACAINEVECNGGLISLLIAGLVWLGVIFVGSEAVIRRWHGRPFQ